MTRREAKQVITYTRGRITYTVPKGLDRRVADIVEYAAVCYGFLLNESGRRAVAHTWGEFSALIRSYYAQSPRRDAVLSALASL